MMDGLEAVEIRWSVLKHDNHTFRFDSEYFKKEYLENEEAIKRFQNGIVQLQDETLFMSGGATPLGAEYPDAGIPFLRVQNVMKNYIADDDIVFINPKDDENLLRSRLKENDVLLTITGVSYGKSATVTKEYVGNNINQHSVKITLRGNQIKPYFLSTFLNSRYGKLQSDKNITGVTRPALDYEAIRRFTIPLIETDLQNTVANVVKRAHRTLKHSKLLYQEAENILLEHLGLKDWQPSEAGVSVKSFAESFGTSARLDAEHYQPKYDELIEAIKSSAPQYKQIKEFRTYNSRGLQPEYVADGQLDVINSRHILEQHLDYENFEKTDIAAWQRQSKARVFENDILIYTTGANIGRTNVYLRNQRALASNHVNILRVKDTDPIYLGFVMNSVIGRLQTEKLSAGSAQAELYPKDIDEFLIPFIDEKAQQQIVSQLKASLEAKELTQQLLELAKRGVELAIEESEAAALVWIEAQLAELGVDFSTAE